MPFDMKKKHVSLAAAELALLERLWEIGPATKRDLMQGLYPKATESDRATVQKLLERLEAKGYVTRNRDAMAHVFAATVSKAQFAGMEMERLAERFADGSCTSLVAQFVKNTRLSAKERAELRKLLDRPNDKRGER
jgi:predicted transcriptional regulator